MAKIRLSEDKLYSIIQEAVVEALNEYGETSFGKYQIGRAIARRNRMGLDGKEMADHFTKQQGSSYKTYPPYDDDEDEKFTFDDAPMQVGFNNQRGFMNAVDKDIHPLQDRYANTIKTNAEYYDSQNPNSRVNREKRKEQRQKYRLNKD